MARRSLLHGSNRHCYGMLQMQWVAQHCRAHGAAGYKVPKALCDAQLPRNGIVAVQHHPDHISRRTGRWKGRVKGFAATPVLAQLRTLATLAYRCCNRAALCMLAGHATSWPRLIPEHNLECKGALERPRSYLDGGAHTMLPQCDPSLFTKHRCTLARLNTVATSSLGCNGRFPGGIWRARACWTRRNEAFPAVCAGLLRCIHRQSNRAALAACRGLLLKVWL